MKVVARRRDATKHGLFILLTLLVAASTASAWPLHVEGFVWYDLNKNGIQDSDEPGVPGIVVTAYQCTDDTQLNQTTTDSSGRYATTVGTAASIPPFYLVFSNLPAGFGFTLQDQGADDTIDSDADAFGRTACYTWPGGPCVPVYFDAGLICAPGVGTPGYWFNHPEAWPVTSITVGGILYSQEDAIAAMKAPTRGDTTFIMFQTLVAAMLNVLVGNDGSCVSSAIADANAWLTTNQLGDRVSASSAAWKEGEPLKCLLDQYNNGQLCAPSRDSCE